MSSESSEQLPAHLISQSQSIHLEATMQAFLDKKATKEDVQAVLAEIEEDKVEQEKRFFAVKDALGKFIDGAISEEEISKILENVPTFILENVDKMTMHSGSDSKYTIAESEDEIVITNKRSSYLDADPGYGDMGYNRKDKEEKRFKKPQIFAVLQINKSTRMGETSKTVRIEIVGGENRYERHFHDDDEHRTPRTEIGFIEDNNLHDDYEKFEESFEGYQRFNYKEKREIASKFIDHGGHSDAYKDYLAKWYNEAEQDDEKSEIRQERIHIIQTLLSGNVVNN